MPNINWKKRAQEAEEALGKALAYAYDYGNANGECESGYLQHPGYICHKCNQDRSVERVCGLKKKGKKKNAT
jgi:hypothetical protein